VNEERVNSANVNELREGEVLPKNAVMPQDSSVGLIEAAQIDQQIATAHKYPRSVQMFRQRSMDMACLNETVAESCLFALPRDGKVVEGPSIRLAEIILSNWGNCRVGSSTIHEGAETITARGIFHDLETNVALFSDTQRRIVKKNGQRFGVDMIVTTANAAQSIALRNAVVRGIPRAIWWDVYRKARAVAAGDAQSFGTKRAAAIEAFKIFGVSPERIFAALGVAGEADMTREHLVALFGMLTAIKDGEALPEDSFPMTADVRHTAKEAAKDAVDLTSGAQGADTVTLTRNGAPDNPEADPDKKPAEDEKAPEPNAADEAKKAPPKQRKPRGNIGME